MFLFDLLVLLLLTLCALLSGAAYAYLHQLSRREPVTCKTGYQFAVCEIEDANLVAFLRRMRRKGWCCASGSRCISDSGMRLSGLVLVRVM